MRQSIFSKVKNELVKPFKRIIDTDEIKMMDLNPNQGAFWQENLLAIPVNQDFYEFDDTNDALSYLKMLPQTVARFFSKDLTHLDKQKKLAFLYTQLTQLMLCLTEEKTFTFKVTDQYRRFVSPNYSATQLEYDENVWIKMSKKELDRMQNNYEALMARTDAIDNICPELVAMNNLFQQMTDHAKLKENLTFFNHSAQKEVILKNILTCKITLNNILVDLHSCGYTRKPS